MTRLLQEKKSRVNFLDVFAVITFILHIFTLVLLVVQGFTIHQLSTKKPPTLVQVVDGSSPVTENLQRDDETIRQFVSKITIAMFNWSGKLPPSSIEDATNLQPDAGIPIKTTQGLIKKVPTTSWVASFGLGEDFRKGFLAQIADMVPAEVFIKSPQQAITAQLTIQRVYPPQKIAPGKWRVGMVANIVQVRGSDNKKVLTPFNKDFLVRAVDTVEHPLPEKITELQKAIYSIRTEKLEISEISDLCLTDGSNSGNDCQNLNNFTR
jgi:hypothetical protein